MTKKILIAIFALLLVCAPAAHAEFRWGVFGGYAGTSLKTKQYIVNTSAGAGFQAGGLGEMMFPGLGFGLSFGLAYNMENAKMNLGQREVWKSLGYGNETIVAHSLLIPIHLRFKWTRLNGLEDIVAPLVYGGPDFNIQVAHGSCDAFDYSGGDLGLTVGGGAELYKRWQITGGYSWGMTYFAKTKLLDNYSMRARQWHLRVTYFF